MLFIILQIGVALVDNIGGFLVLRFLSGVAVSPPATLGAGTITDVSISHLPSNNRFGDREWSKSLAFQHSC
jgi:hypothetical protein